MGRDIDDIRKAWKRAQADAYDLSEAWSRVTYNAKKDGSSFSTMSRNFNGVEFGTHMGSDQISVTIYGQYGYVSDSMTIEGKTFHQIRAEIKERANCLAITGDNYTSKLTKLEHVYETFKDKYMYMLTELRDEIGDGRAAREIASAVADECNWRV